jgi:hypothetical protein
LNIVHSLDNDCPIELNQLQYAWIYSVYRQYCFQKGNNYKYDVFKWCTNKQLYWRIYHLTDVSLKTFMPMFYVIIVQPWLARTTDLSNKFAQALRVRANEVWLYLNYLFLRYIYMSDLSWMCTTIGKIMNGNLKFLIFFSKFKRDNSVSYHQTMTKFEID